MATKFITNCHCGKRFRIPNRYEGKRIRCPGCGGAFRAVIDDSVDNIDDLRSPSGRRRRTTFDSSSHWDHVRGPAEDAPEALRLTVLSGPDAPLSMGFPEGAIVIIGRRSSVEGESDFCLPRDRSVSRNHCMIHQVEGEWQLRDLSRNGILQNDAKVKGRGFLESGDRLTVGKSLLAVSMVNAESECTQRMLQIFCSRCDAVSNLSDIGHSGAIQVSGCKDCRGPKVLPRTHFPGLEILGKIGQGGMGAVYLARSEELNQLVALKTLLTATSPDDKSISEFMREFQTGSRINHPNAVRVHSPGAADGCLFYLMEFIHGLNAKDFVAAHHGLLSPSLAITLILEVASAIDHLHGAGLVHRDIKPANIMITESSGQPKAMLVDYGLTKSFECVGMSAITLAGQGKGTPSFMSPEQARDAKIAGPPADIYSLGATLYYLLSGHPPLVFKKGRFFGLQIVKNPPVSFENRGVELPEELDDFVMECLEKDPADRPESVADFMEELLKIRSNLAN